ncbi:MAG: hypothetical protein ACFFC7_09660, partial [Candidatus Hermodarchaeota archaeon]
VPPISTALSHLLNVLARVDVNLMTLTRRPSVMGQQGSLGGLGKPLSRFREVCNDGSSPASKKEPPITRIGLISPNNLRVIQVSFQKEHKCSNITLDWNQ